MKNKIFILGLMLILIASIGFVSAIDVNNSADFNLTQNSYGSVNDDYMSASNDSEILEYSNDFVNEEPVLEESGNESNDNPDEGHVIYVGKNVTAGGGNGSFDNPYNNFNQACSSVNGEDKVTLKIFNGTYTIGSLLKFNTSSLNICGLGEVIIKNEHKNNYKIQAFGLVSSSANYTMSNIIFDASTMDWTIEGGFLPFSGMAKSGVYNNCSFIGNKTFISGSQYDTLFYNCYFNGLSDRLFEKGYVKGVSTKFKYCSFIFNDLNIALALHVYDNNNISFDSVWFGQNSVPSFMNPFSISSANTGRLVSNYKYPLNRYAILDIHENFLGNNQYEIVGKLMWNDSSIDGIEMLHPIVVELSSSTGEIQSQVIIKDGGFKVNYTSNLTRHEIFAKADFEEFDLEFESIDIAAPPQSIYYGDDQNILVGLPQAASGFINVTVNNKTYIYNVTEALFNFTVLDVLKEGIYDVKIDYIDTVNHFYGNNSTQIRVSKVSDYDMDLITLGDVKFGDVTTITIELPEDASGLVTVKVADRFIVESANKTVIVNITGLGLGNNRVNVTYQGNDKYISQSRYDTIYVDRGESDVSISRSEFVYGQPIAIGLNLVNAVGFNAQLLENSIEINGTTIQVPALDAGIYILEVTTEVSENYTSVSKRFNIEVFKAESRVIIPDMECVYGDLLVVDLNSTSEYVEVLDSKNVSRKVSGNVINTSEFGAGNYTVKIIRDIDKNHADVKIASLTVLKALPSIKINAGNVFAGENVLIEVILPVDAEGSISINGLYTSGIINGKASVSIPNLDAGRYHFNVTYSGDGNYKSASGMTAVGVISIPLKMIYSNTSTVGEKACISIILLNNTIGNFTLFVNGNACFNGIVGQDLNLTISELKLGLNKLNVLYSYDLGNYSSAAYIDVGKATPYLNISAKDNIVFNLPEDAKGNLTIFINNKTHVKELVNGCTALSDLPAGTYNITAAYNGDDKYSSVTENVRLTIEKLSTVIVASGVSTAYGTSKKITITLKDAKNLLTGKTVAVMLNGVKYTKTTDSKGQISLTTLANLAVKTHIATVTFAGDGNHYKSTATFKVTVKKAASKITANKKTFKKSLKVKKYTITLKSGKKAIKKVQVTLKIKGKTYRATTNAKGKATFKIKKLTKLGKHTAVIKFKGNKSYKPTTKKVKLTVKK